MRLVAKILIILICFSCSDNAGNNRNNVKIGKKESKLVLTANLKASYSNDFNYYYLVELKLINNTKTECEFYSLTCGSLINVLTDSKQVSFLYHNCPTNFGVLIKLLPNQEYSIPVILYRNKYMQSFKFNVKFGFIINKPKSGPFSKNSSLTNQEIFAELKLMREKQENVIWTDPIILTTTNYSPYEIRNIINDSTYSKPAKN
jgi:hypothetical protein